MLIYGVVGVFGVQCFSKSPMHGIAFLGSSFQRVGTRIVGAFASCFFKSCMQRTVAFSSPRSNRAESDRRMYVGRSIVRIWSCSELLRLMLDIDLMCTLNRLIQHDFSNLIILLH